jgi:hypothetical protein
MSKQKLDQRFGRISGQLGRTVGTGDFDHARPIASIVNLTIAVLSAHHRHLRDAQCRGMFPRARGDGGSAGARDVILSQWSHRRCGRDSGSRTRGSLSTRRVSRHRERHPFCECGSECALAGDRRLDPVWAMLEYASPFLHRMFRTEFRCDTADDRMVAEPQERRIATTRHRQDCARILHGRTSGCGPTHGVVHVMGGAWACGGLLTALSADSPSFQPTRIDSSALTRIRSHPLSDCSNAAIHARDKAAAVW